MSTTAGFEDAKSDRDNEESGEVDRYEKDILDYFSNFLVKTERRLLRLAHLSVRQFLEDRKADDFAKPRQHLRLATDFCLLLKVMSFGEAISPIATTYVTDHWWIHCRDALHFGDLDTFLPSSAGGLLAVEDSLKTLQRAIACKADFARQDEEIPFFITSPEWACRMLSP